MSIASSDPYASLRINEFRYILSARLAVTIALQIQAVVVGWQIYDVTNDPLALGLIGLAEAIPFILISLVSGYVADSYNRKTVYVSAISVVLLGSIALYMLELGGGVMRFGLTPFYGVIVLLGFARGFMGPTLQAFWAQIVPRMLYPNAATWSSNIFNFGAVSGPALGGFIYSIAGGLAAYASVCVLVAMSIVFILQTRSRPIAPISNTESFLQKLTAGLRYVFARQTLVGSMSLDMFAVLFGGAVALLPAFAKDVLGVGALEMSWLRSAPFLGSVAMGAIVVFFPPNKHTGKKLFFSVAGFGVCILAFALSESFWLSMAALAASGAFDKVSMVIRGSILQLMTPDEMRGRVAAVSGVFIGSSNEIGAFESGAAASLLGLVPSVIFGGSMTLVVAVSAWFGFPLLRKFEIEQEINSQNLSETS